ncbi:MAG: hypothetical protein L3J35_09180 [Bacteroidales bacterium]|nr:hypothetical protein [Bacteroidales bacterium]
MKYFIILFSVFFVFSCSTSKKASIYGGDYKVSKELNSFLSRFELATNEHNETLLLSLLDKKYKKEHFNNLQKEDREHFFREFFCGKDIKTRQYVCPAFNEVISISFISIFQTDNGNYKVTYAITTTYEELEFIREITVKTVNDVVVFGITGALY